MNYLSYDLLGKEGEKVEILLVEDNLGDVWLTVEALKESNLTSKINVVPDGVEAMAFLRQEGSYQGVQRPDIILLDLNLPKKDGREVLQEIKSDEDLRRIPVLILTTSSSEPDIVDCYNLHANCYITKPFDLDQFNMVVRAIQHYWFSTVTLSPK
jgi:CheY-like chemotaxis protein